jgi:hypothetical protein
LRRTIDDITSPALLKPVVDNRNPRKPANIVELTLHRGIAVDRAAVTQVAARIRERGMQGDEGKWAFRWLDLRPHLSEILQQPSLYAEITRQTEEPSFSAICACGDAKSATYYACKHNLNEGEEGLIITFRSPILDCYVDCRDFLCSVSVVGSGDCSQRVR